MKIYTSVDDFKEVPAPVLTTGTFDGVHLGHRTILNRINHIASETGGESVLLTFSPHPRLVLFPDDNDLKLLNTQEEKIRILEDTGLQHLIIFPFTRAFSRLSYIEYVRDLLVGKLGMKKLVIGYDHHFGRNREGSYEQLAELAPLYDFKLEEIPAQDIDEVNVSSTKIRRALVSGDVSLANEYLGYQYPLKGIVIKGKQLGRSIGFPTANLGVPDAHKLIPGNGSYAVTADVEGNLYKGMMNVGVNPTIDSDSPVTKVEVHLFDCTADLYDKVMNVRYVSRLRDEKKFDDLNALRNQLEKDKEHALRVLV